MGFLKGLKQRHLSGLNGEISVYPHVERSYEIPLATVGIDQVHATIYRLLFFAIYTLKRFSSVLRRLRCIRFGMLSPDSTVSCFTLNLERRLQYLFGPARSLLELSGD